MYQGIQKKLAIRYDSIAKYYLGENLLNDYLGKPITIRFTGEIQCTFCGKELKKAYNGSCFLCNRRLACNDLCQVRPELCHYANGTCRQPEWGDEHCFINHYVYLANSSGVKVGITRHYNTPSRWLDQGAIQAMIISKVGSRKQAGELEVQLKNSFNDKTNWRKLLSDVPKIDLHKYSDELKSKYGLELEAMLYEFKYPVIKYPDKIKSIDLTKGPIIAKTLLGIKGQYLIFDNEVINIRKYEGFNLEWSS